MYKIKTFIFYFFSIIVLFVSGTSPEDVLKSKGFIFIPETTFFFHGYKNNNSEIVTLHDFWICNHKITVGEYRDCINFYKDNKNDEMVKFLTPQDKEYVVSQYYTSPGHYNDPIRYVSLKQVEKYCEWLSSTTKDSQIVFSIIDEMQWECVAFEATNYQDKEGRLRIKQRGSLLEGLEYKEDRRKDVTAMYNISFNTDFENKSYRILPYNKYKPNSMGVYDMIGNLREITYSNYKEKSKYRVGKGAYYGDPWETVKIEDRYRVEENKGYFNYGFRIVANYKKR